MARPTPSKKWPEAVVGSLSVLAGAWVHEKAPQIFHDAFAQHPNWLEAITYIAIGTVAFVIIWTVSSTWERAERRRREAAYVDPIPLADVGLVDGSWIELVWRGNDQKPSLASVVRITSTNRENFSIRGSVYAIDSLRLTGEFDLDEAYPTSGLLKNL